MQVHPAGKESARVAGGGLERDPVTFGPRGPRRRRRDRAYGQQDERGHAADGTDVHVEPLGPAPRGAIRGSPLPDDAAILGLRPEARTSENGEAPARGGGPDISTTARGSWPR